MGMNECIFSEKTPGRLYLFGKRVFDVIVSLLAGIVLCIPMAIIALIIWLDSPGPAIFKQERLGKGGKPFVMYKFRSMYVETPDMVPTRDFCDADKYVTRVGAVLRRTSIDELPQLINIFIGDMSVVGYRAVCISETSLNELREKYEIFCMRPGLTGMAQVLGRDYLSIEEKVEIEKRYLDTCSFWVDLWCLLRTVTVVLSGEGVK